LFLFLEAASFNSENGGTWACSVFFEMFPEYNEDVDICSMLLRVNEIASKEHAKKDYKQSCQLVYTTTKKVYFPSPDR
jgi:hypothetical protein